MWNSPQFEIGNILRDINAILDNDSGTESKKPPKKPINLNMNTPTKIEPSIKQPSLPTWCKCNDICSISATGAQKSGTPMIDINGDIIIPIGSGGRNSTLLTGFLKYNPSKDECTDHIKFSKMFQCHDLLSAAMDIKNDLVFIPNKYGFIQINMKYNYASQRFLHEYISGSVCIVVEDTLHIFGVIDNNGVMANMHTLYSLNRGSDFFCENKVVTLPVDLDHGFSWESRIIHIESEGKLLFLCDHMNYVLSYDIANDAWGTVDDMTFFNRNLNHCPGVVLSGDKRYMIIFPVMGRSNDPFGGYSSQVGWITDPMIEVVDLHDYSVSLSKMRLPFKSEYKLYAFLADPKEHREEIVHGYIKDCWRRPDFKDVKYLSLDVINIISWFYCEEEVHIVQADYGQHWKIGINALLM